METCKPKLDKQFLAQHQVAKLPATLVAIDGWEVLEAEVDDVHFKSPAWPVANRQTVYVRVVARCAATGALRLATRSIDVPDVETPPGYVRSTVHVAGYELVPLGPDGCRMAYVNVVDPTGMVPPMVVAKTVPDRAMIVARVKRLLETDPAAWHDPFAPAGLPPGLVSPRGTD